MEMSAIKSSLGTKILKFILVFAVVIVGMVFIIPVIFGIFGPIVTAIPFSTPTNYIVADFMGVLTIVGLGLVGLYYTCKLTWR